MAKLNHSAQFGEIELVSIEENIWGPSNKYNWSFPNLQFGYSRNGLRTW
jgi:hypothetical protein